MGADAGILWNLRNIADIFDVLLRLVLRLGRPARYHLLDGTKMIDLDVTTQDDERGTEPEYWGRERAEFGVGLLRRQTHPSRPSTNIERVIVADTPCGHRICL